MNQENIAQRAAAIFVDDGGDDAYEFASNYIWFDPTDGKDRRRAWREAETLWVIRVSRLPESARHTIAEPRLYVDEADGFTQEDFLRSA